MSDQTDDLPEERASLREGREIFMLTEPCGRQVVGYCDVDGLGDPVEDDRGYVVCWEPLMVVTSVQTGAVQVRPIHSFDWSEKISVYKPTYLPGGARLREVHAENIDEFYQQYLAAEKKRVQRDNRVVPATEVSPRDIAASEAARQMRVKH
jgi:hypothetical protein